MPSSRLRLAGGAILVAVSLAAVPSPAAAAGPDPATAYIERIAYGNPACPQGTVGLSFSEDRRTVTAIPDQYGSGSGGLITRKLCTLSPVLHVPLGCDWTSTRLTVTVRGREQLTAGFAYTRIMSVWVNTQPATTVTHPSSGPAVGSFVDTDAFVPNIPRVVSPPPLAIKSELRPTTSGTNQQVTVDAIEIVVSNATSPLEQLACGLGLEPVVSPVLDLLRP